MKTVPELDAYMKSRNYSYMMSQYRNNGEEYMREYVHKNGISTLCFEKQSGIWINCF